MKSPSFSRSSASKTIAMLPAAIAEIADSTREKPSLLIGIA
jgi:hypothetical protein